MSNDFEHNLSEFNNPEDVKKHHSEFELPDGSMLSLNDETFKATEILFKPELSSDRNLQHELGLHHLIAQTLNKVGFDLRRDICENVCLSGGCMDIRNMAKRLEKEVKNAIPASHLIEYPEA